MPCGWRRDEGGLVEPRNRESAFEILGRSDPVDRADLPAVGGPMAERIRNRILATPRRPERRRQPRWRLRVAIAALAAVAVAATWVVFTRDVTEPRFVSCYEAADLNADIVVVEATALDTTPCEPLWRDGTLTNPDLVPPGEVPGLVVCVNDAGALAVVPGSGDLCRLLDLAPPTDTPDPQAVLQLRERLLAYFAATDCAPLTESVVAAEAIVADLDLPGWRVVETSGEADRVCASHALDPAAGIVYIVPVPHP